MAKSENTVSIHIVIKSDAASQFAEINKAIRELVGAVKTLSADMAGLSGQYAKASADSKAFQGSTKGAASESVKLRDALRQNIETLGELGTGMQALGRTLTQSLTRPVVNFGNSAVKAFLSFRRALVPVQRLIADQPGEIFALSDAIEKATIDYAQFGQTVKEVTDGMEAVVSTFDFSTGIVGQFDQVMKTAVAGTISARQALNLLSKTALAYNDTTAAGIERVSDLAFKINELGQTTFKQLAAALPNVTQLGGALNVTLEELSAAMSTLTKATKSPAVASTQLKATLASVLSPTKDLAELMGRLGVATGQAAVSQFGLVGFLKLIREEAVSSGKSIKDYLGRIRSVEGVLALTGPLFEEFTKFMRETGDVAGLTDEVFDVVTGGINEMGFSVEQMTQKWAKFKRDMGEILFKIIRPLLDSFSELLDSLNELPGDSLERFGKLAIALAAIGPILKGAGGLIALFASLRTVLAASAITMKAVFSTILPIVGIAAAIGGTLGALFFKLGQNAREAEANVQELEVAMDDAGEGANAFREEIRAVIAEIDALNSAPVRIAIEDLSAEQISRQLELLRTFLEDPAFVKFELTGKELIARPFEEFIALQERDIRDLGASATEILRSEQLNELSATFRRLGLEGIAFINEKIALTEQRLGDFADTSDLVKIRNEFLSDVILRMSEHFGQADLNLQALIATYLEMTGPSVKLKDILEEMNQQLDDLAAKSQAFEAMGRELNIAAGQAGIYEAAIVAAGQAEIDLQTDAIQALATSWENAAAAAAEYNASTAAENIFDKLIADINEANELFLIFNGAVSANELNVAALKTALTGLAKEGLGATSDEVQFLIDLFPDLFQQVVKSLKEIPDSVKKLKPKIEVEAELRIGPIQQAFRDLSLGIGFDLNNVTAALGRFAESFSIDIREWSENLFASSERLREFDLGLLSNKASIELTSEASEFAKNAITGMGQAAIDFILQTIKGTETFSQFQTFLGEGIIGLVNFALRPFADELQKAAVFLLGLGSFVSGDLFVSFAGLKQRIENLTPLWEALSQVLDQVSEIFFSLFDIAGIFAEVLGTALVPIFKALSPILTALGGFIEAINPLLALFAKTLDIALRPLEALATIAGALISILTNFGAALAAIVSFNFDVLPTIGAQIRETLETAGASLADILTRPVIELGEGPGFTPVIQDIALPETVADQFANLFNEIAAAGTNATEQQAQSFLELVNSLSAFQLEEAFAEAIAQVSGQFLEIGGPFAEFASDINQVLSGIQTEQLAETITQMVHAGVGVTDILDLFGQIDPEMINDLFSPATMEELFNLIGSQLQLPGVNQELLDSLIGADVIGGTATEGGRTTALAPPTIYFQIYLDGATVIGTPAAEVGEALMNHIAFSIQAGGGVPTIFRDALRGII
jgi:TP901 family phage tail tape measure protein